MIDQIIINNFKCFKNQTIDLSKLTVLTGGNASGKSSAIQALLVINKAIDLMNKNNEDFVIETNDLYGLDLGIPENLIFQERENDLIEISCSISDSTLCPTRISVKWDASSNESLPYNIKFNVEGEIVHDNITYLNAERIGPRVTSSIHGFNKSVGNHGEYAAYLMWKINSNQRLNTDMKLPEDLEISEINRFSANCEEWISRIIPNTKVEFEISAEHGLSTLKYSNFGDYYVPTATGFGISYIIPIIVQGLACSLDKGSILIVENPEAHLHPYSQSQMGKFLALLSHCGVQVIIETHSEHIINGCRLQSALLQNTANVKIHYFVQNDRGVQINEINVNEFGELSLWPEGFFDQSKKDIRELLELRKCGQ